MPLELRRILELVSFPGLFFFAMLAAIGLKLGLLLCSK
jgi:hypothetical protein